MANNWQECKNILCIRPDNMGDLIMSGPALRALKTSFGASITILTSSMAAGIAYHIPEIDEVLVYDLPWVKTTTEADIMVFNQLITQLKEKQFDAAVIFTVYSQNPLPSVMLAYLAGIPKRLAYCRENPYQLLTDWVPDKEPYSVIKHQVIRDLDLVAKVNAKTENDRLNLTVNPFCWQAVSEKLVASGVNIHKKWMVIHAGVSEVKREYPADQWIVAAKRIVEELDYQVIFTGSEREKELTNYLAGHTGKQSFSAGGLFSITELITLISHSPLLLSVNTGTVHIAAAVGTPVIVLYALTNPQHTPWKVQHAVLPFSFDEQMQSKNEVIRFVNQRLYDKQVPLPQVQDIINTINSLLPITSGKITGMELYN